MLVTLVDFWKAACRRSKKMVLAGEGTCFRGGTGDAHADALAKHAHAHTAGIQTDSNLQQSSIYVLLI